MKYLTKAGVKFISEKRKYHPKNVSHETRRLLYLKSKLDGHETNPLSPRELEDTQKEHKHWTNKHAEHISKHPSPGGVIGQFTHFRTNHPNMFDKDGKITPQEI
tara:strand:- start:201 stop:512 length:312 start_codon:yes stop_codon:yes gene_type:complete